MRERNILSRIGDQLLHFTVVIGKQHHRAFATKNSSVWVRRGNSESQVAQLFTNARSQGCHVAHAHLRSYFVIPIVGRIIIGGARSGSAVNHQARVDQSWIQRQSLGVDHICSDWRNHYPTFSNRGNPSILNQHRAIFNAFSRLHNNCCVLDQVAANLSRAHGHWRRILRVNRGNATERQKSKRNKDSVHGDSF